MASSRVRQHVCCLALGTVLVALLCAQVQAAGTPATHIPAFPGAEGFGSTTPGGRGGRIIEVTNLNTSGPGSLQAACSARGPRIVVFRVSGIIDGGVGIGAPFITIAGQTAPGDGICLRKGKLSVNTHDVIIRYIRSRPGDHPFGYSPESRDCIGGHPRNMIVDHCSFSWGIDENVNPWGKNRNITFQWCLITEALWESLHPKGPHSMAVLFGKTNNSASLHHCLLAHCNGRSPRFSNKPGNKASTFDCRNNGIYNHGPYSCSTMTGKIHINYVANFIKLGPNGRKENPRGLSISDAAKKHAKVYVKGNVWPGKPKGKADDWRVVGGVLGPKWKPYPEAIRAREPVPVPPVTTQSAEQAFEDVLRYAGCTRPVRDVIDDRVIAEVRAGAGRIIDSPEDVGGYPTYASTTPPQDTDHDAMPDAWEKKFGFNPDDASDGPKDRDGDGYTNVEEFLNLTDPTKADTGAPIAQGPVKVQAGNDRIRGEAARKFGEERMARAKGPNWTEESGKALRQKVRESGKEVADLLGIKFVPIPPGELKVGSMMVTLTKAYELSACEITQAQWETVMGARPWSGKIAAKDDPACPATFVSYDDCREFIKRLNACGKRKYRLPTYCEWLHAARGGTDPPYGFGKDESRVPEYAWCALKYRGKNGKFIRRSPEAPQAVGRLKPNAYGLYNMAGNVREWVHDWRAYRYYDAKRYRRKTRTDPMGPKTGDRRLVCGGHFRFRAWAILMFTGATDYPYYRQFGIGFRLRRAAP